MVFDPASTCRCPPTTHICRALLLGLLFGLSIATEAAVAEPTDIALLVGVWDYTDRSDVSNLSKKATENTISLLKETLEAHGFTVCDLINPDTATFRDKLHDFFSKDVQRAVFYFTGHGIDGENTSYLLLNDSIEDEQTAQSAGLKPFPLDELPIAQASARKLLVVLDACYAGRIVSNLVGDGPSNSSQTKRLPGDLDSILGKVKAVSVITAGGRGRPVQAGSAFGEAFACSLANPATSSTITSQDVVDYVEACMSRQQLSIPKLFDSNDHGITFNREMTAHLPPKCASKQCAPSQ